MRNQQIFGWTLLMLIGTNTIIPILGYPSVVTSAHLPEPASSEWNPAFAPLPAPAPVPEARKFAEKPNASKKVLPVAMEDRNDIDDINTNQIQQDAGGFSWSNMIGMVMQLLFNPAGQAGPNKSDNIDTDQSIAPSPWANLLTVGLKILTALLGGGGAANSDGIDKVDNSSPMQGVLAAVLSAVLGSKDPDQVATMAKQAGEFINIVVNLLDALKTSFSHRSLAARSIGKKDSVSEAAVASITLLKVIEREEPIKKGGYMTTPSWDEAGLVRTMKTSDNVCMQRYVCEANRECTGDMNGSSAIYCQLGTYATSFLLQRTSDSPFDAFYEAGRRGRSGDDCHQQYLACNEV